MSKQTYQTRIETLLTLQNVTHPDHKIGTPISVAGAHEIYVWIAHALIEGGAANSDPQKVRIEGTNQSAVNDWYDLDVWTASNATPFSKAFTAIEPVNETEIAVVDTTNFAIRDLVYIQHGTDINQSEWHVVEALLTTPNRLQISEGLSNEQPATSAIWKPGELVLRRVDLRGVERVRVTYDSLGSSARNSAVKVMGVVVESLMG